MLVKNNTIGKLLVKKSTIGKLLVIKSTIGKPLVKNSTTDKPSFKRVPFYLSWINYDNKLLPSWRRELLVDEKCRRTCIKL